MLRFVQFWNFLVSSYLILLSLNWLNNNLRFRDGLSVNLLLSFSPKGNLTITGSHFWLNDAIEVEKFISLINARWIDELMMNWFCGMVDRRKACSLISSRDHCQGTSPLRISNTPRARFESAQNLVSGFVEWSCARLTRLYLAKKSYL